MITGRREADMLLILHILNWAAVAGFVMRALWLLRLLRYEEELVSRRKLRAELVSCVGVWGMLASFIIASAGHAYAFVISGVSAIVLITGTVMLARMRVTR
jgi:hypothetical protein